MLATDILHALDHAHDGYYRSFVTLGDPCSYLIDSRLHLFRAAEQWAIVVERLGYSPRGGRIELELFYYGNCLVDLPADNGRPTNVRVASPISWEAQWAITLDELLAPAATTILIRDIAVRLTHDPAAYAQAGIELVEFKPGRLTLDEVGRFLIREHADLLRATNSELYQSLPAHLARVLMLDEWYHRDFYQQPIPEIALEEVNEIYQRSQESWAAAGISSPADLAASMQAQRERQLQQNREEWEHNRPSSYETWQQLAQVLATGDAQRYQPTLPPNTHWRHWPDSGAL